MGYLHCCWQPNACAKLFSVLLPTHLHYLVKSRLSRALLPTHLKCGLFALLLAIQSTVAKPFTLQSELLGQTGYCTEVRFASFLSCIFITMAVINPPEKKLANRTSVQRGKNVPNISCSKA